MPVRELAAAMRKTLFVVLAVLAALVAPAGGSAQAAELLMFEDPTCVWCRRWHAEIGPGYPRTPEGQFAPLRRVHIHDQELAGVALERRITVTPTFVLAEDGREVGRIVGYPGNSFFWELLGELLRRVPKAPAAPPGNQPEPASYAPCGVPSRTAGAT
jgi:hypothetical protein